MKKPTRTSALALVEGALKRSLRTAKRRGATYRVPSLWSTAREPAREMKVNPHRYFLDVIARIKRVRVPRKPAPSGGEWSRHAVIYNMFVRTTAAYDHNGNGRLDLPLNDEGFRETGTFLKAMAMLPYVRRLGANTVHLLPITSIGQDGNKGTLGSPYAIRNPYALDESLGEPGLGLDVATQFKAFVEAAHRLGLRVVVEFVFRTAAKDADWCREHPEWFYWIREGTPLRAAGQEHDESRYGSPLFTPDELRRIHEDVREHRFDALLPPHKAYRDLFAAPPPKESVVSEGGRWVGTLADGTRVKIPGAFADWPPDDSQPPWGDVTYLRMYDHPDFNYIAYNTIRMYDGRLAAPEHVNRPLWQKIVGIIPFYQKQFRIDGVMIDMGHALPMALKAEMVKAARRGNADFAFWDENFSITQKSREEGYNAVFGFTWVDQHHPERMQRLCRQLAHAGFPIPFFATPENHNTPRAADRPGGLAYARWAMVVNSFLPAIPFLHSGYELGERYPINTGLDFTREQLAALPSERLPLFSESAYDWCRREQFTGWVAKVLALRSRYAALVADARPESFHMLDEPNPMVLAFERTGGHPAKRLAVIGNMNYAAPEAASVRIETRRSSLVDLLTGERLALHDGRLGLRLEPGACLLFEF